MTKQDDTRSTGQFREFAPFLAPGERAELRELLSFAGAPPPSFAETLRATARAFIDDGDSGKLRTVCLLVADLFEQGWGVVVSKDRIVFEPPGISRTGEQTVDDVKLRVRNALNAARARQLVEPSVTAFLRRMERRSVRSPGIRSSILDLVDSGAQLADKLSVVAKLPDDERDAELARLVDPVVEICQAGRRCSETGLPLNDIWRYFRHTWAHEYRPIPGRQLLVLIRNAARPRRPVIGIAMLASPVMRVTVRDNWIGWLRDAMEMRLRSGLWHPRELAAALSHRLDASIAAVRWDDIASADDVASPVENTVLRLEQKASGAAFARGIELRAHYLENLDARGRVKPMRGGLKDAAEDSDWQTASQDLLFVRKRSELLAQLLFAKQMFRAAALEIDPAAALDQLLSARSGQRAVDIVLTEFRKAGLSSRVVDVSICGAVHPYNELLGGKLVALLLASKEVRDHYSERYSGQVSVIASQMAGKAVSKPADLRVLTTTSLYGVGSSQYNRLVIRAEDHPGLANDLRWDSIGKSKTGGFGTLHLGAETAQALRQMAQSRHDSRRVNNRFGEGTSPRLRQIREGLDALGVDSDTILHHATPRLFYACELGAGSRTSLLGMESENFEPASAAAIGSAWRRRWLAARATRDQTLSALRALGPASVQASLRTITVDDLLIDVDDGAPSPV